MVKVERSQPAPACLNGEKEKANGDYKCGDVLERLKTDFNNKCYICEYREPPSVNVEHLVSHQGNRDLKFDWNNLFWACSHCNNIKLAAYDDILDCTNPENDVENWIRYDMKIFPGEEVRVTSCNDDPRVDRTVDLLMKVYNGSTTLKTIEAGSIRTALLADLLEFQNAVKEYFAVGVEEDEKNIYLRIIKRHLKRSSAFTAFKRWIVKENPLLKNEFNQYLD